MKDGKARLRAAWVVGLAFWVSGGVQASETLQLKPGLWKVDSEVWVAGQSLKAAMQALKRNAAKAGAPAEGDAGTQCVTAAESKVDIDKMLQKAMGGDSIWSCSINPNKREAGALKASFDCRTTQGGRAHGDLDASYGDTSYRVDLNGRSNVVDGRTGSPMAGSQEFDVRLQSEGRWVGGACQR